MYRISPRDHEIPKPHTPLMDISLEAVTYSCFTKKKKNHLERKQNIFNNGDQKADE